MHQKHAKLNKVGYGNYARQEVSIHGTECNNIRALANELSEILAKHFRLGYLDTDHITFKGGAPDPIIDHGGARNLTLMGNHWSSHKHKLDDFDMKLEADDLDLLITNGNHHPARSQVLVLDERKKDSLLKKKDQLTNVLAVLSNEEDLPDWFSELIDPSVPVKNSAQEIATVLFDHFKKSEPVLKGLVLAGGKSERMGQDKASIDYHGQPQYLYACNLLEKYCDEVYLSVRDKDHGFEYEKVLEDRFVGLGPYGAILSALQSDPHAAWLVVAVDLPLLNEDALIELISHRKTSKYATAFYNPATDFPDPLCTIWEPRSYKRLLDFLAMGYSCPRKVLINSEVEVVEPQNPAVLKNVNTPDQLAELKEMNR